MRDLFEKIYNDVISTIVNKVDKKSWTMKILKLYDFCNGSFGGIVFIRQSSGYVREQPSDVKECIYNTIHCKYGEYHYQVLKYLSDISSFIGVIAVWWAHIATIYAFQDLKLTKSDELKKRNNWYETKKSGSAFKMLVTLIREKILRKL